MVTQALNFEQTGREIDKIPVNISYEIIHLFSEGLYKSPHKAIEELVTNGYDAGATQVHIILPESDTEGPEVEERLWVIDDGHGMDEQGFHQLWRIAESAKADVTHQNGRPLIGQFGIGKLASYVLAWNLTHISRVNSRYLLTTMNFHTVMDLRLKDGTDLSVSLREIDEQTARSHLQEIETLDPNAWDFMFGGKPATSWTAAALSDFKDLYDKLRKGTLRWVLSTGLPLHSDFKIWLDNESLQSSKETFPVIKRVDIDESIPNIGKIKGEATIYTKALEGGKSDQINRSRGFFVRVRRRVINLEDELFGLETLNLAAWSRFALEVHADGLREHLLSSREGVRDSEAVRALRTLLRERFNECRVAYDRWNNQQNLDLAELLSKTPNAFLYEPLMLSVRESVESGTESFYVGMPRNLNDENTREWLSDFEVGVKEKPFQGMLMEDAGENSPALRYDPDNRELIVNRDHPFIDKLRTARNRRGIMNLFASSEALLEGQLRDHGIPHATVASLLDDRDRTLRIVAGFEHPTAREVMRRLRNATADSTALERAVGAVFGLIGFRYERKGGNQPGPDGILTARLGRHGDTVADYKLVYDAKVSNKPAVPADKVDPSSLNDFRKTASAEYGFFIAEKYEAEDDLSGKLNRKMAQSEEFNTLTLLKVHHLYRLVQLHYIFGVTLTEIRPLFDKSKSVADVDEWIDRYQEFLEQQGEIPLRNLLTGLDLEKTDVGAKPNIAVVRSKSADMRGFSVERLKARLTAVESIVGKRWINVDADSFEVEMHQRADEILNELERRITDFDGELLSDAIATAK